MNRNLKNTPQRKLSQYIADSPLGLFKRNLGKLYKENRRLLFIIVAVIFGLSLLLVGLIAGLIAKGNHQINYLSFGRVIGYGFKAFKWTIIVWLIGSFTAIWKMSVYRRESHYDEELDVMVSERNDEGLSRRMADGPEKEEAFSSSRAYTKPDYVLGRDIDHPENTLAPNYAKLRGINNNLLVIGPPGSMKTRAFVIPYLYSVIRRGESCICTDSKADLYGKFKLLAEQHGYQTKFINYDITSIIHSDAVDLFGPATKTNVEVASFAQTVVNNLSGVDTSPGHTDYWADHAYNLLAATMIYVARNDSIENKSLSECTRLIAETDSNTLASEFTDFEGNYSDFDAAAEAWINTPTEARDSARTGLGIKLAKLRNTVIAKITSGNEVDITLPGKQKCLYFVNLSDQKRELDFLTALLFDEIIAELTTLAMHSPDQALPVRVHLLFEEFANIGRIPSWNKRINTLRSRNIKSVMIIQSEAQLAELYPDHVNEQLIEACACKVLLTTGDVTTAERWSKRGGYMGVETKIRNVSDERAEDMVKLHSSTNERTQIVQRLVFPPDYFLHLKYPKMVVDMQGYNLCPMERLDYTEHPMTREMRPINALHHIPQWVLKLDPDEYSKYDIDRNTFSEEFKTDEQMLIEAGYKDVPPYFCSEKEFSYFRDPEEGIIRSNNPEDKYLDEQVTALARVRKEKGYQITADASGLFDDDN